MERSTLISLDNKLTCFLVTLGIALVGAYIFQLISIPLPWILGPLFFLILAKRFIKRSLYWPSYLRDTGLVFLGYLLGASFTIEAARDMIFHLPSMLVMTILTIIFSIVLAYVVSYTSKSDFESVLIGSMPGGLSQMVILGEELNNVDETIVAFMQMIRLMIIMFAIPFLTVHFLYSGQGMIVDETVSRLATQSGENNVTNYHYGLYIIIIFICIWIVRRFHFPTPFLIGPLVGTMFLIVLGVPSPEVPSLFFVFAQLFIGAHLGSIMNVDQLSTFKKLGLYSVLSNIILIGFSFSLALLLTFWNPIAITTSFLSVAPGGIAEMGITAKVVNADLATVTAYQLFRLFFILLIVPPVLKWWIYRKMPADKKAYPQARRSRH
jgi:membrane AbrB-like protein